MKRLLKVLKWIGLSGMALIAIVLIVVATRSALAGARLRARVAALRAAAEPVTLADLARGSIPPQRNAATYLHQSQDEITEVDIEINNPVYESLDDEEKSAFDNGRPGPRMIGEMRAVLAAHPELIGRLRQAAECPDYDPQIQWTTEDGSVSDEAGTEFQLLRAAARVLGYQAKVQLADGRPADALETCLLIFRLAGHADRNPLVLNFLIGQALRGLAVYNAEVILRGQPLPASAYEALEKELNRLDLPTAFQNTLRGERAYGLQNLRIFAAQLGAGGFPWINGDMCDYLDIIEAIVKSAPLTYRQWSASPEISALHERQLGVISTLLFETLESAYVAMLRTEAQLRSLRVLNAILRHAAAGDLPEPVAADKLGLPTGAASDPFTGELLHVKKQPDGWCVYSVGIDSKDDGGVAGGGFGGGPDVGVGLAVLPNPEAGSDAGNAKDNSP